MVTRGRGWEDRDLEEGGQKVQTFSCKIDKYQGCNVPHGDYSYHCCMIYRKVFKKVNLKSSHQKEKIFLFFNFSYFYCIYMWRLTLAETIVVIVSQYL